MKKSIILVLAAILVLIGGLYSLDAYLCSHLYYGWNLFTSATECTAGQGAGINMLGTGANWKVFALVLFSALIPLAYMVFTKRITLKYLLLTFTGGAIVYALGFASIKEALLGPGWIILLFNYIVLFALAAFFVVAAVALGDIVVRKLRWKFSLSINDIFLRFALGLITFCVFNILLLHLNVFFGVVVWLEFAGLIYLVIRTKKHLREMRTAVEDVINTLHKTVTSMSWVSILYYIVIVLISVYVFIGFNNAFIPYPTAWDANHAYIFIPRAWSAHNGLYWGVSGASFMPQLWYGFLTFWYKLTSSIPGMNGMFGMSPDNVTVSMNFWSGIGVFLAAGFLIQAFLRFLQEKTDDHLVNNKKNIYAILFIGLLFVILWLTSGMGAFLVFVDNKTDLAVLFFGTLALYAGIQFIRMVSQHTAKKHSIQDGSDISDVSQLSIKQMAIVSGVLFAASALAKPTGMFDIAHFAILFLLQWQVLLFGVGAYVTILGFLGATGMYLVRWFLTGTQSLYLIIIGAIIMVGGVLLSLKKYNYRTYLRYFFIWVATIVVALVVYKAPFSIGQQLLTPEGNIKNAVRNIILGKAPVENKILLASTVSVDTLDAIDVQAEDGQQETAITTSAPTQSAISVVSSKQQCLSNPLSSDELYKNLKEVIGSAESEDLGRYVGYGWKQFDDLFITHLIPNGCYSVYVDARHFCSQREAITNATFSGIVELLKGSPETSRVVAWKAEAEKAKGDTLAEQALLQEILTFVQSNVILKDGASMAIPYKFLIPFNVSFNWSLQNLSSYYTDIGFVWILALGLIVLGLLYGLIARKKELAIVSLIALGAWATRWIVASGIIWYSLGLILWTILGMIAFLYYMYRRKSKNGFDTVLLYGIAGIFVLFVVIQLVLNIVRISSQGGSGPFVWYKANVGQEVVIDDSLQTSQQNKIGYSAKDVFNLQFPYYNVFLDEINGDKTDDNGVIVAGTYAQYFIHNQRNVQSDGFLIEFWKNASDNNICNTYQRLQDKNVKYLVIDPNIASVVMGEGNNTLLERFLGSISPDGKIQQYGALTMLQSLVQNGYLKLFVTNNIVSKYAYIATDDQLATLLGISADDKERLLVERAKMSAARFFPDVQTYANAGLQLLALRLPTPDGMQDLADIMGKKIDLAKVNVASSQISMTNISATDLQNAIAGLTDDEKAVLQQYIVLQQTKTQDPSQYRQYLTSMLTQSVSNGSQNMVFIVE